MVASVTEVAVVASFPEAAVASVVTEVAVVASVTEVAVVVTEVVLPPEVVTDEGPKATFGAQEQTRMPFDVCHPELKA